VLQELLVLVLVLVQEQGQGQEQGQEQGHRISQNPVQAHQNPASSAC